MAGDPERPLAAARASGLVEERRPLLALLSGGADSVCLLDVALRLGAEVSALHVRHGLRGAESAADAEHCARLCERLGVQLVVHEAPLASAREGATGNLQAEAREARYAAAERLVAETGADYATGHTASDQAETVLYRLAVSPGRRALLGMRGRRGRLVRPLLAATRADTRAYCAARGLGFRDDASNADLRFARARVREEVLPALRALNPEAERAIAETALLLRDEAEVLDAAVADALARLGGPPAAAVSLGELRALPPALARLALRRLAEDAAGEPRPLSRAEADRVLALGAAGGRGGTAALDLAGGLRAVAEYGVLRFARTGGSRAAGAGGAPGAESAAAGHEAAPTVRLPVPGAARFGPWEVEARLAPAGGRPKPPPAGPDAALLAPATAGAVLTVRAWRPGDRIRPAGLGGTKTLQDLFTDRKVPRALRHELPVVEAGGEVVWVAGVAVAEQGAAAAAGEVVVVSARRAPRE